jgi:hypothetical protein
MTAARFLYISGGCFLLAGIAKYLGKEAAAFSLYVPGIVFLICGSVALVHNYFAARKKP